MGSELVPSIHDADCMYLQRSSVWGDRFDRGVDLLFDPGRVTFDAGLYELMTSGIGLIILMPGEINKLAQDGSFNATAGTGNIVFTHLGLRYRF